MYERGKCSNQQAPLPKREYSYNFKHVYFTLTLLLHFTNTFVTLSSAKRWWAARRSGNCWRPRSSRCAAWGARWNRHCPRAQGWPGLLQSVCGIAAAEVTIEKVVAMEVKSDSCCSCSRNRSSCYFKVGEFLPCAPACHRNYLLIITQRILNQVSSILPYICQYFLNFSLSTFSHFNHFLNQQGVSAVQQGPVSTPGGRLVASVRSHAAGKRAV